jgi:hypothetical protein
VRAVVDKEEDMKKGPEYMRFICEVPESTVDEILTYNEILDHIEKDNNDIDNDTQHLYKFRRISAHQGPLRSSDKDYKGLLFNVLVEWETGETTYDSLDLIASDDPVTCAVYAVKHGLLDTPGLKRFKRYAKNQKKIDRMINQANSIAIVENRFGSLVSLSLGRMHKLLNWTRRIVIPIGKIQKQQK